MLLHFVNNAIAFGLMKLQNEQTIPVSAAGTIAIGWPLMLASAGSLGALLWLLWRTRVVWRDEQGEPIARKYFSVEPPRDQPATLRAARLAPIGWGLAGGMLVLTIALGGGNLQQQRGWFAAQPFLDKAEVAIDRLDYAAALACYQEAVKLAPDDAVSWTGVSMMQSMLARPEEALRAAERAWQLSPDFSHALAARAAALNQLERYREALPDARRAGELAPQDAWVSTVLVEAAKGAGEYQAAIAAAHAGAKLAPQEATFPARLAEILSTCEETEFRDPERALLYAREAVELSKGRDPYSLFMLSRAYSANGRFDQAAETLREAEPACAGVQKLYASNSARSIARHAAAQKELRESWNVPWIDDLAVCRGQQKVLIIVPQEQVNSLSLKPFALSEYAGWQHEVISEKEFHSRSSAFAAALREIRDLQPQWCDLLAWYTGLTREDILATSAEEIAQTLGVDVETAQAVHAAIQARSASDETGQRS
jgi:tetratricopeptide (TPR) repeat protein